MPKFDLRSVEAQTCETLYNAIRDGLQSIILKDSVIGLLIAVIELKLITIFFEKVIYIITE